jgi:hypothetical protein
MTPGELQHLRYSKQVHPVHRFIAQGFDQVQSEEIPACFTQLSYEEETLLVSSPYHQLGFHGCVI